LSRLTIKCIGLALALLLVTGSMALAATFEGKGVEDRKVEISFERERGVIKRFKVSRAKFFCSNGQRFRASMRAGDMALDERKRFGGRFTDSGGKVIFRIEGKVVGRKAHGTTSIVAYVDSYKCRTGRVEWQARTARN
jgi:hypothetical protein